jgi:signal transduction histidine kinase
MAMTVIANILLVDDKPKNLYALEELLAQPDRKIFAVESGREALHLVLQHDFALVLLDVEMPTMDGYETAQILRSTKRTRLIPIIFVTANDSTEDRTYRGYEAGAIDFLFKPINTSVLRAKVDLFVELYRKKHELERMTAQLRDKVADLEYVHQTLTQDLRAPLRSIRSFASAIAESSSELDASATDALDRVIRASDRMSVMLEDLYSLLMLSADPAEPIHVELRTAVDYAADALRTEIERSGAVVHHVELPKVFTNRRLLVATLQNLLANALRFRSQATPRVDVTARRLLDGWQVAVRDNGVGIPEAERARVFKLFTKLDHQRSGSGVGLALCERAVAKLGGRIWIEASGEDGTTICFTIPDEPPER